MASRRVRLESAGLSHFRTLCSEPEKSEKNPLFFFGKKLEKGKLSPGSAAAQREWRVRNAAAHPAQLWLNFPHRASLCQPKAHADDHRQNSPPRAERGSGPNQPADLPFLQEWSLSSQLPQKLRIRSVNSRSCASTRRGNVTPHTNSGIKSKRSMRQLRPSGAGVPSSRGGCGGGRSSLSLPHCIATRMPVSAHSPIASTSPVRISPFFFLFSLFVFFLSAVSAGDWSPAFSLVPNSNSILPGCAFDRSASEPSPETPPVPASLSMRCQGLCSDTSE